MATCMSMSTVQITCLDPRLGSWEIALQTMQTYIHRFRTRSLMFFTRHLASLYPNAQPTALPTRQIHCASIIPSSSASTSSPCPSDSPPPAVSTRPPSSAREFAAESGSEASASASAQDEPEDEAAWESESISPSSTPTSSSGGNHVTRPSSLLLSPVSLPFPFPILRHCSSRLNRARHVLQISTVSTRQARRAKGAGYESGAGAFAACPDEGSVLSEASVPREPSPRHGETTYVPTDPGASFLHTLDVAPHPGHRPSTTRLHCAATGAHGGSAAISDARLKLGVCAVVGRALGFRGRGCAGVSVRRRCGVGMGRGGLVLGVGRSAGLLLGRMMGWNVRVYGWLRGGGKKGGAGEVGGGEEGGEGACALGWGSG
ncbi:hypothetical protein IQ07DRAFT_665897, partial [Pyrenochaeta sp. DS3sAY3a]